jgi:hypothetical protein
MGGSTLDLPHDVRRVFLAVERIVVRPRPGWDRAGDRLVAAEGRRC